MKLHLLILILMMTSCAIKKESSVVQRSTSSETEFDSTVYIDRVIADTIIFPADTLTIFVPVDNLKHDTVIIYKSGRASTVLTSKGGVLSVDTRCDSLWSVILSTEKILIKERQKTQILSNYIKENHQSKSPFNWFVYVTGILILVGLASLGSFLITRKQRL